MFSPKIQLKALLASQKKVNVSQFSVESMSSGGVGGHQFQGVAGVPSYLPMHNFYQDPPISPPPSLQQQQTNGNVPFPNLDSSSSMPRGQFFTDQSQIYRKSQEGRGYGKEREAKGQQWIPHPNEAAMVRDSLEERSHAIKVERENLMQKRRELDERLCGIDKDVNQMAQVGKRVQENSKKIIDDAKGLSGTPIVQNPNPGSQEPPTLDPLLVPVFDKHMIILERVFDYYGGNSKSGSVKLAEFVRLAQDYDILPTFLSRKELRSVYKNNAFEDVGLTYSGFTCALAELATFALSKPMFAHLYPTKLSKVNVLLNMWGVADSTKLSEIQNRQAQWTQ
mmetsp:Transcript_8862/g.10105  ORF Transcript_8862/g.10105 Transcript_8862/m.10105 type:complete len:337 (-) Transcript_8862:396-1406(-)